MRNAKKYKEDIFLNEKNILFLHEKYKVKENSST